MKNILKLLFLICLLSASAHAQGSRIDNSVLRPGTGIPGAKISICQPLLTTAAAVSGNQATYTMSSNPITAGFAQGMVVQVAGFTGADTFFNAGTLTNGGIANGQIIVNVTSTLIVTTLVHASASATSNGTLLQVGTATQSCGGLSAIFTDASLGVSATNPNTADTIGNYGFGAQAGIYYVQIYGNGITTQLKQVVIPCVPGSACAVTGSGTVTSITFTSPLTGGTITVSGTVGCPTCVTGTLGAGQSFVGNGTQAPAAGTVVLDMVGISGADLGAKMTNCAAALPSGIGTCKGDNLPLAQTLSTAVTTSTAVVYTFCGQSVSQTAALTFGSSNSGIIGCPNKNTTFTKAANIDQVTIGAVFWVRVSGITWSGNKGSNTGNGLVLAAGSGEETIVDNNFFAEANDEIKEIATTFQPSHISHNIFLTWGTHAYESTGTSAQSIFAENIIIGDGTSTSSAILNGGSTALENNFVKDSNSAVAALVDDTTGGQPHPIIGNRLNMANGTAFKGGANTSASGNSFVGGGVNGPAILLTGGMYSNNTINSANADSVDLSGTVYFSNNFVNMSMSGVSNKCAINVLGDSIGTRLTHNQIGIGDNAADTNYGECDTPSGTHNLNDVFDGDTVAGTLSGGPSIWGFWLNNTAGLNTNWNVLVQNFSCVHISICLKRTDAQNNITVYENIQQGDTVLDNGTGSTKDIFVIEGAFSFATLPSPIGNGSRFYCGDCTQAKPTAGGGAGAYIVREAGQNNGL